VKEIETFKSLPEFTSPPDAVAIDLDGTLFDSNTCLSKRNREALERCISQSIPVVIATSRPVRSVLRFCGEELVNACSRILQNGAIAIAAPPLSGEFREPLTSELAHEIIDFILEIEPEMHITVEMEGYEFGTNTPREPDSLWEINSATPEMQLTIETALTRTPAKIAAGGLSRDIYHVAESLIDNFRDHISVVPVNDKTFLNITSKKATKPNALRKLLGSQQERLENVVAFGDDYPDLDMLEICGISIAVANAIPELKAAARFHTASNDDDGVAVALERMLENLYGQE
jgi:Cof subfamily protein (haloacid dehalogenase superfamily)